MRWPKGHRAANAERGADQLKELKRLQKANERFKKAVSDLMLDKLILAEWQRDPNCLIPDSDGLDFASAM